jgi:hypothetical protein
MGISLYNVGKTTQTGLEKCKKLASVGRKR